MNEYLFTVATTSKSLHPDHEYDKIRTGQVLDAGTSCNIIFQSAIKFDIAQNQSAIFV